MCHFVGNFLLVHSKMKLRSGLFTCSLKKLFIHCCPQSQTTQLYIWCSTFIDIPTYDRRQIKPNRNVTKYSTPESW